MKARQELEWTATVDVLETAFDYAPEEMVSWKLQGDLAMPSLAEIEQDLALGHPSWTTLLRRAE